MMVERFWRSLKYECVHSQAFEDALGSRCEDSGVIEFYNHLRRHQGLANRTPDAVDHDVSELNLDVAKKQKSNNRNTSMGC